MNPEDLEGLYSAPPSQFVRRRSEMAASAQRQGDRAAASEIKKLRKPTLGAWLANLLVHERPDQVEGLLQLGNMLREAQLDLAGPELRRLAQQRHEVIATLVSEARSLARDAGQPVNDDSVRELETTLSAALADADAAEQLRTGRLTTALSYSGFGPLEGVAKIQTNAPPPPMVRNSRTTDLREQQRREAAETNLREARASASAAQRLFEEREHAVALLRTEHDRLTAEVDDLHRQLREATSAATSSESELHTAERSLRDAERANESARERVARASGELERLSQ